VCRDAAAWGLRAPVHHTSDREVLSRTAGGKVCGREDQDRSADVGGRPSAGGDQPNRHDQQRRKPVNRLHALFQAIAPFSACTEGGIRPARKATGNAEWTKKRHPMVLRHRICANEFPNNLTPTISSAGRPHKKGSVMHAPQSTGRFQGLDWGKEGEPPLQEAHRGGYLL
jgi:hypothetical protein